LERKARWMMQNRKQCLFLAVLAGTIAAAIACSKKEEDKKAPEAADGTGKPKIQAVQAEYDFGKVKQGVNVDHTFKIKNAGSADLVIDKTRGS
jgi:hypothetical protein